MTIARKLTHRHLKHVEVAGHRVRREAGVVEHSAPVAVPLDADQRGETMLSNQLLRRAEVPRLVASHALLAGHQHVEEVVDHDRHLDTINRGEHTPILRQRPARANDAQNRDAATDPDACSPRRGYCSETDSTPPGNLRGTRATPIHGGLGVRPEGWT